MTGSENVFNTFFRNLCSINRSFDGYDILILRKGGENNIQGGNAAEREEETGWHIVSDTVGKHQL
jgi:hypothetical protein